MAKRIPNLDAAIAECKRHGVEFKWEPNHNSHIKFYIKGKVGFVLLSCKNDNRDRVRKSIAKHLTA